MNPNIIQKTVNIMNASDEGRTGRTASFGYHDEQGRIVVSAVTVIKTEGLDTVWFSTNTPGRKARLIPKDSRAGINFFTQGDNISLTGTAEIITDDDLRQDLWLDWFERHYPDGPLGDDYCLIKFTAEHARLYVDDDVTAFDLSEIQTPQSYCGLICDGCEWVEKSGCNKCIASKGNPFYGECKIAVCCLEKGLEHCGFCEEMPCDMLYQYAYGDGEHCDNPKGARLEILKYWRRKE